MRSVLIGLSGWMLATGGGQAEFRVRVQDYAQVPAATMARATTIASALLERAGVEVAWANCSPHSDRRDQVCRMPLGPLDLQIRVLNRAMAKRTHASRHSMGYAMVAGRFPSIASVFYHRTLELEAGNFATRAEILGAMLAHEIGHLLLAENSHSGTGILRARWGDEDLKRIALGRMWFTPEQAERMISLTAERQRASVSEAVESRQKFVEKD